MIEKKIRSQMFERLGPAAQWAWNLFEFYTERAPRYSVLMLTLIYVANGNGSGKLLEVLTQLEDHKAELQLHPEIVPVANPADDPTCQLAAKILTGVLGLQIDPRLGGAQPQKLPIVPTHLWDIQ